MKAVSRLFAEITFDATNGEIHFGKPPCRGIAFLTENAEVALGLAAVAVAGGVCFNKLDGLHEHSGRAATGIEDAAFVGCEHFNEELDDATSSVKLSALLPFGAGELAEEIFVDAPQNVFGAALGIA